MTLRAQLSRLPVVLRAARRARRDAVHERLAPDALRALQQERFAAIVRHAAAHSPFYRAHWRGLDVGGPLDPGAVPPVDKPTLMERFDEWPTDRRIRLADVEAHLAAVQGDGRFLGTYRVCATGGSTGRRGVFLFADAEWEIALGAFFRHLAWTGSTPRLPRRRVATVMATSPLHMTARFGMSGDAGLTRLLRLDAREPLDALVAALQRFRPDQLAGYPSVVALLAEEQLAGRLRIAPSTISTSSEVRTPEMEARMVAAWGVQPFDLYATTETAITALDCERHAGLHLFEDLTLVENVDAAGRPVPDGVLGHHLLVTNFWNRTQPVVRYEVSDTVAVDATPCACGRTFRRLVAVEGRADDVLHLPAADGRLVPVHPLAVRSPFAGLDEVRQYQVVHEAGRLRVRVVPRGDVGAEALAARVRAALDGKLAALGVVAPPVDVEIVPAIARAAGHGGKFKLVEVRRTAPAAVSGGG